MNIKVNKLSSSHTQLPYEYYSLPYCRPDTIVNSAENLGEVLRGDRIENSVYTVRISHPPRNKIFPPFWSAHIEIRINCSCDWLTGTPAFLTLQLSMRVEETCKVTCSVKLTKDDASEFKSRIDDEYRVNM